MKKLFSLIILSLLASSCSNDLPEPKGENDGNTSEGAKEKTCTGKYCDPLGIFILSEGNMSTETGFLSYLTSSDEVQSHVYKEINNKPLGNVTQDLFFLDDRIYVIAQNGKANTSQAFDSEGKLVAFNRGTLKKIDLPNAEAVEDIETPTHLALLDKHTLFVANKTGIYRIDPEKKGEAPVLIEKTQKVRTSPFAVCNDELFAPGGQELLILDKSSDKPVGHIDMRDYVIGVLAAKDKSSLWVATQELISGQKRLHKVDAASRKILESHVINEGEFDRKQKSGILSAKGDTLYYNSRTKIYRHIFGENSTKEMRNVTNDFADAEMAFSKVAVHPITGRVYINVLKDWSEYKDGFTVVYDFTDEENPIIKSIPHTHHFSAGIFFPPTAE